MLFVPIIRQDPVPHRAICAIPIDGTFPCAIIMMSSTDMDPLVERLDRSSVYTSIETIFLDGIFFFSRYHTIPIANRLLNSCSPQLHEHR